jgi:hypothetical protein
MFQQNISKQIITKLITSIAIPQLLHYFCFCCFGSLLDEEVKPLWVFAFVVLSSFCLDMLVLNKDHSCKAAMVKQV